MAASHATPAEGTLGDPDAGADEAMRAFFESDFDDSAKESRGRFLRRK